MLHSEVWGIYFWYPGQGRKALLFFPSRFLVGLVTKLLSNNGKKTNFLHIGAHKYKILKEVTKTDRFYIYFRPTPSQKIKK